MNQSTKLTLPRFGFLILCLAAIGVGLFYGNWRSPASDARTWTITTTSPTGEFKLTLTGRNDPPPLLTYETGFHSVKFSVAKSDREFISNEGFYRGGSYDSYFLDQFPVQEWVGNSAIRFGPVRDLAPDQMDEVVVQNDSGQTLSYFWLNVAKVEKFLIFELAPGEKVKLLTYPQTLEMSDFSGFSGIAMVVTGGRKLEGGGAFKPNPGQKRAGHFVINVSENGIRINSSDFLRNS